MVTEADLMNDQHTMILLIILTKNCYTKFGDISRGKIITISILQTNEGVQ